MHADLDFFARRRISLELVREHGEGQRRPIIVTGVEDQPPKLDSLLARARAGRARAGEGVAEDAPLLGPRHPSGPTEPLARAPWRTESSAYVDSGITAHPSPGRPRCDRRMLFSNPPRPLAPAPAPGTPPEADEAKTGPVAVDARPAQDHQPAPRAARAPPNAGHRQEPDHGEAG